MHREWVEPEQTDGGSRWPRDGIVHGNTLASYAHLRCTGSYDWAERFVGFARAVGAAATPGGRTPERAAR